MSVQSSATVPVEIGTPLAPRGFGPISMTDIVRYQGASGDMNPMHHDDVLAQSGGYPAAFSVGMLHAGYLAAYCTDVYGTRSVRRFRTRFRGLVYRGDVLTANGRVTGTWEEAGESGVELEFALTNQDDVTVVEGSARFTV